MSFDLLGAIRGSAHDARGATRFEIVAARLWNVLNEGKPFTPVFVFGVLVLLGLARGSDAGEWGRWLVALLVLVPLFVVFFRFDFPLRLRWGLWVALVVLVAAFRPSDWVAVVLTLGLYITFTVVLWGSIYYHLRIGTPLTNFTRFWRLVIENPDPTSGNFLEQAPKCLILVLAHDALAGDLGAASTAGMLAFTAGLGVVAVLLHQWFFTWPAAPSLVPTVLRSSGERLSKRVIVIVIDGCRADRLREAHTPCLDRLRAEGLAFEDMRTVYPARTVTGFSSMLTGATPRVHGMRSNFVPSLGVKCESIFDVLQRNGMRGRLVGIAHLVDAFGDSVETVTAVTHNDQIDEALVSRARQVLEGEAPDLLVLQTLSVDQTGHARGSYNREYLQKIEETDRIIERFLAWCGERGYLDGATVIVTSDHGQGIGIGGHGHHSPGEVNVPCILWGAGVPVGVARTEPRMLMDIAPTVAYLLGVEPPAESVGQVLTGPALQPGPLAVIIPAHNEAANLPAVLACIPRGQVGPVSVIVVDDGSSDGTGAVARAHGADVVVRHDSNRGLGAALRTGLETARGMDACAAVYLDADGEYDAAQIPLLLQPIEEGRADYVLGSRYRGERAGQRLHRNLGNRVFTALLCLLAGRRISDGQTGFRAFSRRALGVAEIVHDYNYAQVLTLDLLGKGMVMAEVPITYQVRTSGRSFINWQYLWRVPVGITRELLGS